MNTTKKNIQKPAPAPTSRVINVKIRREAYDIIMKKAKLTRRSFMVTLDMILGV